METYDMRNRVTILTGASSGIGRATALRIAGAGGSLVLAARQAAALHELAYLCAEHGAEAMAVPTDVTDEHAVLDLAERTMHRFGRIDALVNNAAVSAFGNIEQIPMKAYRRVLETNVIGYVHCIRAILPYMRERGSGVIINVSSVVAKAPQPFTSAYSISKCAIEGLTEAVRAELIDVPGIELCTIYPPSVDTPLFQHAANYSGRRVEPMQPVYPAEQVAQAIIGCIVSPRREVYVSAVGPVMALLKNIAPGVGERLFAKKVRKDHFSDEPARPSDGNLLQPDASHNTVSGGWRGGDEDPDRPA